MTNLDDLLNGPTVVYTDAEILARNALKVAAREELRAIRAEVDTRNITIDHLAAENAAMREALEKIAGHQNHHYAQAAGDCMEQMISDARAALGGRDEGS